MNARPLLLAFSLLAAACTGAAVDSDRSERGPLGKADNVGSCQGACGDQSLDGSCYCDDECALFGDCCDDIADSCALDQCDPVSNAGCGYNETCTPGVCILLHCGAADPADCCEPATCQPSAPTCESMGGICATSPGDPGFPALCESDLGMLPADGTCPAFNEACCVPASCPPIAQPGPDFCPGGVDPEPIMQNGCAIGFECPQPTCESLGGTCSTSPGDPGFAALCDSELGMGTADGSCPAFNQSCCIECPSLTPPPPGFCGSDAPEPVVDDTGCVVSYTCPVNECEDNGGFCASGGICPADTFMTGSDCPGVNGGFCCQPIIWQ